MKGVEMRKPVEPIFVSHLFPQMRAELLAILEDLSDDEWEYSTGCEGWTVRDVALHILGDDVGLLSGLRDHDGQRGQFDTWEELITFINAQNALWVNASRRISRRLLISLLALTGQQWADFAASLDPYADSGPIGWTGNDSDPMWLHLARELTEYWMHHQHICKAVSRVSLKEAHFVHPVLSTLIHALPRTYRDTDALEGTTVRLVVTGQGGGEWHLVREGDKWRLYADTDSPPASTVIMDVDTTWRLLTKGISPEKARSLTEITGDLELGQVLLGAVAILA
jgi:uncharacterized protein (TIGR03083 family)